MLSSSGGAALEQGQAVSDTQKGGLCPKTRPLGDRFGAPPHVEDEFLSLKNPRRGVTRGSFKGRDGFGNSSSFRSKGGRRRRRSVISVLIACAAVAVLVAADHWANQEIG